MVGSVRIDFGEQQVARWTATTGETLDSVYGSEYAQGINDDDTIVGSYTGSGIGWFFRDGVFDCIPLPDPCGSFNNLWRASSGQDINTQGVFTGAISPAAGQPANDPVQAYLGSFNVGGEVVGYGQRAGLPGRRAFLIRPAVLFAADHERGDLSE